MTVGRTKARIGAGLLGLTTLVGTERAHADPAAPEDGELPVAVLTLQTLDAFEQADALTSALKVVTEQAPGWSVPSERKEWALQVLVLSLGCKEPPDAACEEKIAGEIKADRFLWGTMEKKGSDVVGELHLWQRGIGSKSTPFRYSANLKDSADESLLAVARERFLEVAGPPVGGTLEIDAGGVSGTVQIDGKEVGSLSAGKATFPVSLGAHRVEVLARGYEPMEARFEIKARATERVSLVPVKVEKGVDLLKVFGFTSLGLGVGAAGVATFAGVQVISIGDDVAPYKSGELAATGGPAIAKGKDGCEPGTANTYPNLIGGSAAQRDEFATLCSNSATYELLQFTLWPAAGVLAGAGATMLGFADWSDDEEETALPFRIEPRFGPGVADVSLRMKF
jgi:hypothetical protein